MTRSEANSTLTKISTTEESLVFIMFYKVWHRFWSSVLNISEMKQFWVPGSHPDAKALKILTVLKSMTPFSTVVKPFQLMFIITK